jgi:hypothetical protein
MTLSAHAVVGAALSSAFRLNPGASLLIGFMSHFLLDRVPHWDYELPSANIDEVNPFNNDLPINRQAWRDWSKIGLDVFLGLSFTFIFFLSNGQNFSWLSLLAGALGGMLPDGLQLLYMKLHREPFILFYRLHVLMHSPYKIKNTLWGPFLTLMTLLLALLLGNYRFFI